MTIEDIIPLPHPHMLVLRHLVEPKRIEPNGGIGWSKAIPPELLTPAGVSLIDPKLLFVPLIERGMIGGRVEDAHPDEDDQGPDSYIFTSDVGKACLAFGYMLKAMAPTSAEALQVMAEAPMSPTLDFVDAEDIDDESWRKEVCHACGGDGTYTGACGHPCR